MNSELINLLKYMATFDQDARFNANNKFIVYSVDMANEAKICSIVDKYGYPTKKMVGEEGLKNFWLLIQHVAFNTELQEKCLKKCGFGPIEYAHLYDRIQVNKGLDQKYGTQLNKPILDLEETDKNRVKIGWLCIEDWIKDFNSKEDRKLALKKNADGSAEYLR